MRDALGLQPGTPLEWVIEGSEARVKAKTLRIGDFANYLGKPPNGKSIAIEDMDDAIGEAVASRFEHLHK